MGWCSARHFFPMSDRLLESKQVEETKSDDETKQADETRKKPTFYTEPSGRRCVTLHGRFNLLGSGLHEANECFPWNGSIVNTSELEKDKRFNLFPAYATFGSSYHVALPRGKKPTAALLRRIAAEYVPCFGTHSPRLDGRLDPKNDSIYDKGHQKPKPHQNFSPSHSSIPWETQQQKPSMTTQVLPFRRASDSTFVTTWPTWSPKPSRTSMRLPSPTKSKSFA